MLNGAMVNTPVRTVTAKAELLSNGSADVLEIAHNGNLKSFTINRVGASKFFGFGVCAKANIKIRDINREYNITTNNYFKLYFNELCALPLFYVTEVNRDENTNELSITAYDAINKASAHTVAEVNLESYTIGEFVTACANLLGVDVVLPALSEFNLTYEAGANFDGAETLREALDAAAEATQTIYYINADNKLTFKRLDKDGEPAFTIGKDKYFTLDSKTNRRLAGITSATELGDNVGAVLEQSGTTQYIRDNPFWELREDVAQLVDNALATVGGLTINQFSCSWRGNYLVEIGDKLGLITKDNELVYSYLLNDTLDYNGALTQATEWEYTDTEETEANPTNLGETLKQTFAKVDKANKQIDLVASQVDANTSSIAALQINTESISGSITSLEKTVNDGLQGANYSISELTKKVSATITKDDLQIEVETQLNNGVSKIETATGFTFNEKGLTVSKSDSEISTTITENGMTVSKNSKELLTANNDGVKAIDLHATTYLIIGKNSRFEDLGSNRTACFWIGG